MGEIRQALEKIRDERIKAKQAAYKTDYKIVVGAYYDAGFTYCMELLLPVLTELESFNRKFSPGDDRLPEMRKAWTILQIRLDQVHKTPTKGEVSE